MKILTANTSLALPPNGLLSAFAESVLYLYIEHGLVWITIEGDLNDYWLSAGESLLIPRMKQVVIEANHQPSQMEVRALIDIRLSERPLASTASVTGAGSSAVSAAAYPRLPLGFIQQRRSTENHRRDAASASCGTEEWQS